MLSQKELSSILINLICTKLVLLYPRELIMRSANSAWIEMFYVTLIALLLFYITKRIYTKNKNVIELSFACYGKGVRIITGILCLFVLFSLFVSVTRIFPESVKTVLLQDTDTELILAVFVVSSSIGALFGLKAISKITTIILPFMGVLFIGFLLLLLGNYSVQNLVPLFGSGPLKILLNGISSLYVFGDILVLNLLIPYTKSVPDTWRSGFFSIIISGGAGILICLAYGLVFPYPASEEFIMPVYQLTRIINLSSFFNRFEAIFQFAWSILVLLYGATYIYIICYVWQISFGLKYKKPLIFGVALSCAGFALLPDSIMSTMSFLRIFEPVVYIIAFGLPIVVGLLRQRKVS